MDMNENVFHAHKVATMCDTMHHIESILLRTRTVFEDYTFAKIVAP